MKLVEQLEVKISFSSWKGNSPQSNDPIHTHILYNCF